MARVADYVLVGTPGKLGEVDVAKATLEDDTDSTSSESDVEPRQAQTRIASRRKRRSAKELRERARQLAAQRVVYHNVSRTCSLNWVLAISVGFWVALFGSPRYGGRPQELFFGYRGPFGAKRREIFINSTRLSANGTTVFYLSSHPLACENSTDVGKMRNIAPTNELPRLVPWNASMPPWLSTNENDIWCGMLAQPYMDYWPNAAQLIIFTVYRSTGVTKMQAWQGFIGTAFATANLWLMLWIYPDGARSHTCLSEEIARGRCQSGEIVTDDPNYSVVVSFLDVFLVLFIFLVSKASMNTLMFGLSWHVCFMMEFMTPTRSQHGHEYSLAVMVTTLFGIVVAVVATLFVPSMKNTNMLVENSERLTRAICTIWEESLTYYCGIRRSAKRFQVQRQIELLDDIISVVKSHFLGSWWETFNQGWRGRMRILLKEYITQVSDINMLLYAVKHCISTEDFEGGHGQFCELLGDSMKELQKDTEHLMYLILEVCTDGLILECERTEIRAQASLVKQRQLRLLDCFYTVAPDVSEDLAEECIFAFVLSSWSRKMSDFADHICDSSEASQSNKWIENRGLFAEVLAAVRSGFFATFAPKDVLEVEHLKFAARNFVSIALCFTMGYVLKGSFFEPGFSPIMASTLSLLMISDGPHQVGSQMQKSFNRMLGVTLGKLFPIVIATAMQVLDCYTPARSAVQFLAVWCHISIFAYIYYASANWGYVGCLVCGLGVYQLLLPCVGSSTAAFESNYAEIGQVAIAIVVQMLMQYLLHKHSPRQIAVRHLQELGGSLLESYIAFFRSDVHGMQEAARDAALQLEAAKRLCIECDPKLQIAPCGETPFKLELLQQSLDYLQLVLSDMNMLIMACRDWVFNEAVLGDEAQVSEVTFATSEVMHTLHSQMAMQDVRLELMDSLEHAMQALPLILAHGTEEPLRDKVRDACTVCDTSKSAAIAGLYAQLRGLRSGRSSGGQELTNDTRARLNVAVRALENTALHLFRIEELCLRECIY